MHGSDTLPEPWVSNSELSACAELVAERRQLLRILGLRWRPSPAAVRRACQRKVPPRGVLLRRAPRLGRERGGKLLNEEETKERIRRGVGIRPV